MLTIFFCALGGQLYNRQHIKGVVMGLVAIAFAAIPGPGWIALLLTWPVFIIDAACIASRLNRGEAVRPWQFF